MCNYEDIKILAVTRMLNAFCVAGINESNSWIRPVRTPSYHLLRTDIFQGDVCVIRNYNVVRFRFSRQLNNTPQSEDFLVDWLYSPSRIRILSDNERAQLFINNDETQIVGNNIYSYLVNHNRSLVLVRPNRIISCNWIDTFNGRYKPRIYFELNGINYNYSTTDLRWRAFGRVIGNRTGSVNLLNNNTTYFAIGLTRTLLNGQYWPMIVGVHTIPDIDAEIDYDNL